MNHSITILRPLSPILCIITLAFAASSDLSAKIIHRQLDTTVSVTVPPDQYMLSIDMNKDGREDFAIAHNNPSGNDQYVDMFTDESGDIYINDNYEVIPLEKGISISKEISKWNTPTGTGLQLAGDWFGRGPLYVGVRFKIGSYFHYGWIGISIPDDVSSFTLIDLAYEDTPSQAVTAGDDGATAVIEPKPDNTPIISYYNHILHIDRLTFNPCRYIIDVYDISGSKLMSFTNLYENLNINLNLNTGAYLIVLSDGGRVIDSKPIFYID